MKYYKKLCGKHIYLSPMSVEDAEKYTEWFSNAEMTDGLGQTANVTSVESEKEWITKNSSSREFAIVLNESDTLIGNCGFNWINTTARSAEIGIFIGDRENRGKGYGSEAVGLLLEFGFNVLNLHSTGLNLFSFNEEAAACYKKCGFKEAGRRRESYFCNGKYYDTILMDILENEFRNA